MNESMHGPHSMLTTFYIILLVTTLAKVAACRLDGLLRYCKYIQDEHFSACILQYR